jgi:hypothetical protein
MAVYETLPNSGTAKIRLGDVYSLGQKNYSRSRPGGKLFANTPAEVDSGFGSVTWVLYTPNRVRKKRAKIYPWALRKRFWHGRREAICNRPTAGKTVQRPLS